MNRQAVIDHRKERLQALVDQKFGGSKAELGRALGYKDGAFVGQMLRGDRPISEKTIEQIHGLPAGKNWFSAQSSGTLAAEPPATYAAVTAAQAIAALTQALLAMPGPDRETAAAVLSGLARNPEGQWSVWLLDLIQRNNLPQTWGSGKSDRLGIPDTKNIKDSAKMQGADRTIVFGPALTKAFSYGNPSDDERADPAVPPAKKRG